MREAGLEGCARGRRRRRGTTRRGKGAAEDLVRRNFRATEADRIWVADITYVATREGFLYLAFVLDVYSRRIVGWAMEGHLRTELVVDALRMAVWRRRPAPGQVPLGASTEFSTPRSHSPKGSKRSASSRRWEGPVAPWTMPWPRASSRP